MYFRGVEHHNLINMSINKRNPIIAGNKKRTLNCGCGAVMTFHQHRDLLFWCRCHGRKCSFMKDNFHKITDVEWVKTKRNNSYTPHSRGWTTTVELEETDDE